MTTTLLLAIDVGNTNTVFAVYRDREPLGQWRISTVRDRTGDEYAAALTQLMLLSDIDHNHVGDVVISSVVPQALSALRTMCAQIFTCEPRIVGENLGVTVDIAIDNPREVGATAWSMRLRRIAATKGR